MIKRGIVIAFLIVAIVLIMGCQRELTPIDSKIDHRLLELFNVSKDQIPEFVINADGSWNVQVECYSKFKYNCTNVIKKYGEVIGGVSPTLFKVKINKDSLYKLTQENEIQSIEGARLPAIDTTIPELLLNKTTEKINIKSLSRVHVVFEFNKELTDMQREHLKKKDFLYVKYIGGNNYIFSIPSLKINELQELELIKKVKDVDKTQKFSYQLLNNIYPDYAKAGLDKYQIVVKFYDEISFEEADNLLKNYGEVTNSNFDFNYLTIIIQVDKIDQLAEEDIVERTELINPPPSVGVTQND